jgi:hypothetical protein
MARIWKGKRSKLPNYFASGAPMGDPAWPIHNDRDVPPPTRSRDPVLDPPPAYYVYVCGFTFEFWSVEQIVHALSWFEQKVHPTSRLPDESWWQYRDRLIAANPVYWREAGNGFIRSHHTELQRWYERLPQYLQENGKREKVVKALRQALKKFA